MAMGKKIATRESYGNTLVELAKEHDDLVVLDADLAGATKTSIFQKAYPDRFIDCGIAEGNTMGWRPVWRQQGWCRLQARLPCLRPAARLNRCEIQSGIRI